MDNDGRGLGYWGGDDAAWPSALDRSAGHSTVSDPQTDCSTIPDRPLTIALVIDTVGHEGNGTSNSALQYARELERQGHTVRLVGVGAPQYGAEVHHIPFVSWVAAKQQMEFAEPSDELFRRAFRGVDVVHIYLPFKFGRCACRVAKSMGLPVTAGFHTQPENVTYSAGPLKYVPGISAMIYRLFGCWLYDDIGHIHVPTTMIADQLRRHGYRARLHVISNGYDPRFTSKSQAGNQPRETTSSTSVSAVSTPSALVKPSCSAPPTSAPSQSMQATSPPSATTLSVSTMFTTVPFTPVPSNTTSSTQVPSTPTSSTPRRFRIIASGRLTHEKDHTTLIRTVSTCHHASQIELIICGTGPLRRALQRQAKRELRGPWSIGFHDNVQMPALLRSCDLFVHPSVVDIESLSVLEAMASGLVPVIASSELSAAGHFALTDRSLFPARDTETLANRIDWWLDHPEQRAVWGPRYAAYAKEHYSVKTSVKAFVAMERQAIADHRES